MSINEYIQMSKANEYEEEREEIVRFLPHTD